MSEMSRRTALKGIGATGLACSTPSLGLAITKPASTTIASEALANYRDLAGKVKFGTITDLHGGLAADASDRLDKFLAATRKEKCDALLQLGDFAYPNQKHQEYADKLNWAHDNVVHVIGNHEFDYGLTRKDCYRAWGIENSYYRRDISGVRFLVLDGNEKGSTTHKGGYPTYVGEKQRKWLEGELEKSQLPIVVLSHQPLAGRIAIDNAKEIQALLSRFKNKIIICLNGHSHVDSLLQVNGVSYLHINSASYYWVGGKERMAYYKDPLFTVMTLDPQLATVTIAAKKSSWNGPSPKEIGYFDRPGAPSEMIVTPQIRQRNISRM